jgi:hypothetical protein
MASGLGVCSKKQTHVTRQPNTSALTNSWALGQGRGERSSLMSAYGPKRTYAGSGVSAFVDLFHCTEWFRRVNDFPTDECKLRLQRMNFIFRDR